jgi:AAA15 family ATPase/GTPase
MSEHFIKNIKINNFKCFKNFEANGFARVNLITGKNNVGKTAFMEALGSNIYATNLKTFINALISGKLMRETINLNGVSRIIDNMPTYILKKYLESNNGIDIHTNINNIKFQIFEESGIKQYLFKYNENDIYIDSKDINIEPELIENVEFIDNFGLSNYMIELNFSFLQKLDKEYLLNNILNSFDSNIESFKIIDDSPQCKINGKYLELTELGDGTRHLVSIVISLFRCENGYLFIDEIDNGIHYSKLDELWEVILKTSKDLNVQVFATTHSKECIESYARVAKKLADEEVSLTQLVKLKNGEIKSGTYDYEVLESAILEQNHEVRG